MEGGGPSAGEDQEHEPAALHLGEVPDRLLQQHHHHRYFFQVAGDGFPHGQVESTCDEPEWAIACCRHGQTRLRLGTISRTSAATPSIVAKWPRRFAGDVHHGDAAAIARHKSPNDAAAATGGADLVPPIAHRVILGSGLTRAGLHNNLRLYSRLRAAIITAVAILSDALLGTREKLVSQMEINGVDGVDIARRC